MDTPDRVAAAGRDSQPVGIVIHDRHEAPKRPTVAAFIWGGKVRPAPALPFGRRTAA